MTELWLVRHGQTNWNAEKRWQGQSDVPLNTVGLSQAQTLAEQLAGQTFQAIFSSPLIRARQTAEPLAQTLNLPIQTDPRLQETNFGDWDGQPAAIIQKTHPDLLEAFRQDPVFIRPPGNGETVGEVAARMVDAANDIAAQYPNGSVLVTSHGLALATLICQAHNISLSQIFTIKMENTGTQVVRWQPNRVVTLN